MKTKVYIDVLFAVNVWMNFGLLYVTGIWFGYRRKPMRIFGGAMAGGAWSCLLVVLPYLPRWWELLVTYAVVGLFMCRLAFGPMKGRQLVRTGVALSVITVFAGGFLEQLYFHTGMGYVVSRLLLGRHASGGGLLLLFTLSAIAFFTGKEVILLAGRKKRLERNYCQVILRRGDRKVQVTALLDTGNRLYEPVTGRAVSIGEEKALRPLFPEAEEEIGFFLIPFASIGGSGFLKGRLLDGMEILDEEKDGKGTDRGQVMVALREGAVSKDGSYQLILHGDYADLAAYERKRRKKHGY